MAGEGDGEAEGEQEVEEIPGEHGLTGGDVVSDGNETAEKRNPDEEARRRGADEGHEEAGESEDGQGVAEERDPGRGDLLSDPTGAEMEVGEGIGVEDACGEVAADVARPFDTDGGVEDFFPAEKFDQLGEGWQHPDEDGNGSDEIEADEGADAAVFAAAEDFPEGEEVEGDGDVEGTSEAEEEGGLGEGEEEPGADFVASESVKECQQSDHDEEEHQGVAAGFDGVADVPGVEGQ